MAHPQPQTQQERLARTQQAGYFMLLFHPETKMNAIVWEQQTATLGRTKMNPTSEPSNFVPVGKYKTVSREHAEIAWNESRGGWDLKVLGKRGICSNGKRIEKDQVLHLSMTEPTPIKMGESRFYFCPAMAAPNQ